MVNYVYAIGDLRTGEAVLVDPAYDVDGLLSTLAADGMRCVGVVATHYHFDHVGGGFGEWEVEGIASLLETVDVPVHAQEAELPWIVRSTGVDGSVLAAHASGDVLRVGEVDLELIGTPGHTPGSQCVHVGDRLVSGDTLFLEGCGRTDLPGGDAEALYASLFTRLAVLPDETLVFPGHAYSPAPCATMAETRRTNVVLRATTPEEWLAVFGS